jgi:hypothetical protein
LEKESLQLVIEQELRTTGHDGTVMWINLEKTAKRKK